MTAIRTDVVKLGDVFGTLIGDDVTVGQLAPEFTSSASDWSPVNPIAELRGKVAILSSVPALDTRVCDLETRRFNQEAAGLSDDIIIWTISTDPPPRRSAGAVRPELTASRSCPMWSTWSSARNTGC